MAIYQERHINFYQNQFSKLPRSSRMEEDTAASTAILLPHELILSILAHLPLPDLLNASLVSKEFNALSEDNSLWESLYRFYISSQPLHPRPDRWKERCLAIMNGIIVLFPSEVGTNFFQF